MMRFILLALAWLCLSAIVKAQDIGAAVGVHVQDSARNPTPNPTPTLTYQHNMTSDNWEQLKHMIGEIINTGHGATIVRLSFHDAGTFDINNPMIGGPHAYMRFSKVANFRENRGLALARNLLAPLKARFGDKISTADLWHFAAAVVVSNSGGPLIPFRPGRADADISLAPREGLLPDAEPENVLLLHNVFARMGFPPKAVVTLSGAHVMGACHLQNSGYSGQWTRDNTRFSNQYFKNMAQLDYGQVPVDMPVFEGESKSQWNATRSRVSNPELRTGNIMLLNTDFAIRGSIGDPLHSDPHSSFSQFGFSGQLVRQYAADQDLFYRDFTTFFVQMQELGLRSLLGRQIIDVIIPRFNQTTPQGPPSPPFSGPTRPVPTKSVPTKHAPLVLPDTNVNDMTEPNSATSSISSSSSSSASPGMIVGVVGVAIFAGIVMFVGYRLAQGAIESPLKESSVSPPQPTHTALGSINPAVADNQGPAYRV